MKKKERKKKEENRERLQIADKSKHHSVQSCLLSRTITLQYIAYLYNIMTRWVQKDEERKKKTADLLLLFA